MTADSTTDRNESAAAQQAAESNEYVGVGVDSLIVGRRAKCPIYDMQGTLLIGEGTAITSRMKQQLRERKMTEVSVAAADVSTVTLDVALLGDVEPPTLGLDSKVIQQVDSLISDGGLFVANTGSAIKKELVFNGCNAYDEEARERLIARHKEVGAELDGLMQSVVRGGTVDGDKLTASTGEYLAAMVSDADNVLTVASEVGQDPGLSEHCLQMALLGMAIGIEMDWTSRTCARSASRASSTTGE